MSKPKYQPQAKLLPFKRLPLFHRIRIMQMEEDYKYPQETAIMKMRSALTTLLKGEPNHKKFKRSGRRNK